MSTTEQMTKELRSLSTVMVRAEADRDDLMTQLLKKPSDKALQEKLDGVEAELERYQRQARRIRDLQEHAERLDTEAARKETHQARLQHLADADKLADEEAKDGTALEKQVGQLIDTLLRMKGRRQQVVKHFHQSVRRGLPTHRHATMTGLTDLDNVGHGIARALLDAGLAESLGPLVVASAPGPQTLGERVASDVERGKQCIQSHRETLEGESYD